MSWHINFLKYFSFAFSPLLFPLSHLNDFFSFLSMDFDLSFQCFIRFVENNVVDVENLTCSSFRIHFLNYECRISLMLWNVTSPQLFFLEKGEEYIGLAPTQ